jgi:DNA-binding MarR family transcriptional regulator
MLLTNSIVVEAVSGTASAPGLTDQIGFKLRMAQARVWADLVATFEPFGLRPHHFGALTIIAERDGCKQQDIGEVLGIFRSNLVSLVEELTGRGLVNRLVKAADRRSYALSLTPDGSALLAEMNAAHAQHQARLERALAPHDVRRFGLQLDVLLASDLLSLTPEATRT